MHTSTVTQKGQIVIPAALRRKLGFEAGTKVAVTESDGGVRVVPLDEAYFDRYVGLLRGESCLTDALLEARKLDRDREDARP